LLKEGIDTEEILEYFKLIEEQINRGKKLVKNIKNLSELEESEMPLEPINLFDNLRNAGQFVITNFSKREVKIEITSYFENIYVLANELLLDVFENIMMNAIVYNRNRIVQIEVSISYIREKGRRFVKLEFKDNGIGIDDTRKYEILQENHEKTENSKGMGLGLSLAAKLIDLYEGRMWIEDRIQGDSTQGSNFVLLIPETTKPELDFYAFRDHLEKD
jgi:signal transduction histidine kinase